MNTASARHFSLETSNDVESALRSMHSKNGPPANMIHDEPALPVTLSHYVGEDGLYSVCFTPFSSDQKSALVSESPLHPNRSNVPAHLPPGSVASASNAVPSRALPSVLPTVSNHPPSPQRTKQQLHGLPASPACAPPPMDLLTRQVGEKIRNRSCSYFSRKNEQRRSPMNVLFQAIECLDKDTAPAKVKSSELPSCMINGVDSAKQNSRHLESINRFSEGTVRTEDKTSELPSDPVNDGTGAAKLNSRHVEKFDLPSPIASCSLVQDATLGAYDVQRGTPSKSPAFNSALLKNHQLGNFDPHSSKIVPRLPVQDATLCSTDTPNETQFNSTAYKSGHFANFEPSSLSAPCLPLKEPDSGSSDAQNEPSSFSPSHNTELSNADPLSTSDERPKKRIRRDCAHPGCQNKIVQGGLCIQHGAKRKICKVPGCSKRVKQIGLCSSHGPARKRCEHEGCHRVAVQGGRCIQHGAKKKLCSRRGCKRTVAKEGRCKRHFDEDNGLKPTTRNSPRENSEHIPET